MLFDLPFSVYSVCFLTISLLQNLSETFYGYMLYLPVIFIARLLNEVPDYLFLSILAASLSTLALGKLIVIKKEYAWRTPWSYLFAYGLFSVLMFPFLGLCIPSTENFCYTKQYFGTYRLAVHLKPGIKFHWVNAPNFLQRVVRRSVIQSGKQTEWVEILGWINETNLISLSLESKDR